MFSTNLSLGQNLFRHTTHPLSFDRGNLPFIPFSGRTLRISLRVGLLSTYILSQIFPVTKVLKNLALSIVIFYAVTAAAKIFYATFRMVIPTKEERMGRERSNRIIDEALEFRSTSFAKIAEYYLLEEPEHISEYEDFLNEIKSKQESDLQEDEKILKDLYTNIFEIKKDFETNIKEEDVTNAAEKLKTFCNNDKDVIYRNKIASILIEYRPCFKTKEEYKEELFNNTTNFLTDTAITQIMFLTGLIKNKSEAKNFKGSINNETFLYFSHVDSVPSFMGTILSDGYFYTKEEMSNLKRTYDQKKEKKWGPGQALMNVELTSSYTRVFFNTLDLEVISGNISIEEYETKKKR
ncbi:MAG: hypothetical protein Tsb0021_01280 [Chlamydiales bacterium]